MRETQKLVETFERMVAWSAASIARAGRPCVPAIDPLWSNLQGHVEATTLQHLATVWCDGWREGNGL